MFRLLIAGGGTGGHIFPGIAIAEEFLRRDPKTEILFVGTGRPVEARVLGPRGYALKTIRAAALKGESWLGRLRSLATLPWGLFQSLGILKDFGPDLVLGVGGYVSGPMGLAARLLSIPSGLHEQNSVPGMTNRILGRLVDLVFISFGSSRSYFPSAKTHLTGNPVRDAVKACAGSPFEDKKDEFTLLIAGGSQGAHAVNVAAVEAVGILAAEGLPFSVVHQTGEADYQKVRDVYAGLKVKADVQPFITDMEKAYQSADLVICRAGALTVTEVAMIGRPAIFIPLPSAADNHQEINARALADAGAAEIILQARLTPKGLAGDIKRLTGDRANLQKMGQAAQKAIPMDAARNIVDICLNHIKSVKGLEV